MPPPSVHQPSTKGHQPSALLPLALRHGFNVLAGFLIGHGISTNGGDAGSLIVGILTFLAVSLLSWLAKLDWDWSPAFKSLVNDKTTVMIQKAFAVLVSNGLATISGYLATTPSGGFDVNNPEALALFFLNAAASRWKLHHLALGVPKQALLLATCAAVLALAPSCSTASRQQLQLDVSALLASVSKETSREALKLTLTTLEREQTALEAAPIDPDWQKQLLTQSRLLTIKAAITAAKQRLAALTPQDKAVMEVNTVKQASLYPSGGQSLLVRTAQESPHTKGALVARSHDSMWQATTCATSAPHILSARRSASGPPHYAAKPLAPLAMRCPAVPLYAPRVVAALRIR